VSPGKFLGLHPLEIKYESDLVVKLSTDWLLYGDCSIRVSRSFIDNVAMGTLTRANAPVAPPLGGPGYTECKSVYSIEKLSIYCNNTTIGAYVYHV